MNDNSAKGRIHMKTLCNAAKTVILTSAIALLPLCALADEGGSGYRFNGSVGSLAASKLSPGCSQIFKLSEAEAGICLS
jgi:hypothetical protein